MQNHLGIVQQGQWRSLTADARSHAVRRLTQVARQEARSPESGEMDLSDFEDCLVLAEGTEDAEWIYSAQLMDQCDAPMSRAVLALLRDESQKSEHGTGDCERALRVAHEELTRQLVTLEITDKGRSPTVAKRHTALLRALEQLDEMRETMENLRPLLSA